MVSLHPEYVIDKSKHTKAILLPVTEWEKVIEELEELDDIRAYDKAKALPQDIIPFNLAVRELRKGYGK